MKKVSQLAKYIREARDDHEMSQKDLALKLGWSSSQYVSNIERGLATYPIKKLNKLSKSLNRDLVTLFSLFLKDFIEDAERQVFK